MLSVQNFDKAQLSATTKVAICSVLCLQDRKQVLTCLNQDYNKILEYFFLEIPQLLVQNNTLNHNNTPNLCFFMYFEELNICLDIP